MCCSTILRYFFKSRSWKHVYHTRSKIVISHTPNCRVIIIIIFLLFILQNNIKMTILTFMNVDGAFILAENRRKTSVFLFVDSRFINDSDEFWKVFVGRIALAHALKNE